MTRILPARRNTPELLRRGVDPSINVVAVMLMLFSIGVSLIGLRVTRYRG